MGGKKTKHNHLRCSDRELFSTLVRRGYMIEANPSGTKTFRNGETITPMQKYVFYVPEKSYLFKKPEKK